MRATIIPGTDINGQPSLSTQGTRVELAPGVLLNHVVGITLDGQVDGVWRAYIECHVHVQPIKARIRLRLPRPALLYRRGGRPVWRK